MGRAYKKIINRRGIIQSLTKKRALKTFSWSLFKRFSRKSDKQFTWRSSKSNSTEYFYFQAFPFHKKITIMYT